jgi:hypothetical protein
MLCDAKGLKETAQAVEQGKCDAVCTPGALRCNNQIGQKCSATGTGYVSSGTDKQCGCFDGARFSLDPEGNVKDAKTGLTWDFPGNAADTQAGASATCGAKGMRLPTRVELQDLLLTGSVAVNCSKRLELSVDSVAFPNIAAKVRYWTNEPESGFPGFLYVVYFEGPSSTSSASLAGTTDRKSTELVSFQCVRPS